MLVLTRKPGEQIVLGNTIRLTVLGVRGKQIRLGIDAPADVVVVRSELLDRTTGVTAAPMRRSKREAET